MKGYSSNRGRGGPKGTFQRTHRTMITVIPMRNLAVPMNRAKLSANLPNASRSQRTVGSTERVRRPGVFSRCWSRLVPRSPSRSALATGHPCPGDA